MSHELSVLSFCLFSVLSHLSHDLIAFLVAQPLLSVSFRFFRPFRRDIAFQMPQASLFLVRKVRNIRKKQKLRFNDLVGNNGNNGN
jgi:hypothetical protein